MSFEQLEQEKPNTITVTDAAAIMGTSPQFLRACLMNDKFSFGVGVEMEKQREFYINTTRFIKYLKGEM